MAISLITLTTDFGSGSAYAAALKGSLLRVAPTATVLDLTHAMAPQDLRMAAWFLVETLPWFPKNSLHIVVVDPGVGSQRELLYIEGKGQKILAPDNGCWTLAVPQPEKVIRLKEKQWWNPSVSATFHGRDILAPVAGHLHSGISPMELGPAAPEWVKLPQPAPVNNHGILTGEITWVDSFGNLISNIPFEALSVAGYCLAGGQSIGNRCLHYAQFPPGELVYLPSSGGYLEIAKVNGSAAGQLHLRPGGTVSFHPQGQP